MQILVEKRTELYEYTAQEYRRQNWRKTRKSKIRRQRRRLILLIKPLQDPFFLQCAYSLRRKVHRDFLTINHECLFLQVRPEDSFGAAQRKADIVAMHLAFTGEFASCCHNSYFLKIICSILPFFDVLVNPLIKPLFVTIAISDLVITGKCVK